MQVQRQVPAGRQDGVDPGRQVRQQAREVREGVRQGQLVDIVDDEDDAVVGGQLGQNPVHQRGAAEFGGGRRRLRAGRRTQKIAHGLDQREPEQLRILLVAIDVDEHQRVGFALPLRPRSQQ